MIKPELYKRTTDILYQAYFKDTLEHMNCYACAVGNLVAANMGKSFCIDQKAEEQKIFWAGYEPYSGREGRKPSWHPLHTNKTQNPEILSTGYSVEDLCGIEEAFEYAHSHVESTETNMFNGLCAVLNILAEIHQVTDQDLLTSNNNRFKEQYERRAVKIVF